MFSKILNKFKENKWLLAFTIACVVLVAAIIVAIVLGVKLGRSNVTPDYSEGPEVGVYYYDVADGEIVLTLSGGNNFTIAGPGMNKTGSYVATEGGFSLDFIRDEDGVATAIASGDTFEVSMPDGSKLTFKKKVNYTVSFNVDGGSSVDSTYVVNGKTVAKPADPTKEGSVFLGWYSDAALTTPFAFESTVITENTIVYAKWAEKGAEGSSEYTISFDLGYDGAAIEDIKTIGAKAYGITAPERTGYTFCGWYISMYEDGSKLSYAYTDDTVFDADTTLYAVWHEDASGKLIAPKASVSGNSIKWDPVNGAVSYTVVITDASGAEIKNEGSIGTTNYAFDFANYPAGEYTVSVIAVGTDSSKNSDAAVRSYANKTLDRVTDFTVINGILIYNSVEGAEKYYITVDCGNPAHKHENFDNGSSTVFSIVNCSMQKGGIKITVTASAKGYADSVSKTYVYEQNLDAIAAVTYDAKADAFVWFPVENAASYYVELTYGDKTYTANIGNKTSFSIASYSGELSIKVTPVTDGYNSPDAATATFTKTAPAAPTGLTVSGNIVSWDEVEGATSYIVKVNNASFTTETNSYNIASGEVVLVPGDYYSISVQAITATGASGFCTAINSGYLVMDTVVNYAQNTVSWAPVIGATNYLVRVNGGNTISVNGCSATVELTKSGVNTIEVKYTDLGGSKWVSTQVYAYAVTYMSRSISGELTEYVAIGDKLTLPTTFTNTGFDFDGWYNTPGGADGNGKQFTEAYFTYTSDITLYANWSPKTYKVELQTENYDISNITDKTTVDATYTKDFTLPVPVTTNTELGTFLGWYTAANGDGEQLTDEDGNSVITYPFTRDTVAYPFFDNGVLSYVLKSDGTYAVRKGQYINKVKNVTIPEEYNGAKVTTVLENAFAGCTRLVSIEIPNTVQLIGVGAFTDCTRLESINVYTVAGSHEILYSSDDGALVRHDLGTNYLEVVPRAKTGTYVMNEEIQVIRNKAFDHSALSSVVISKSVTTVASRAFYLCSELESIDFIEGRTNPIAFEDDSFYRCNNVKYFKIPVALEQININMLQSLTSLNSISVEAGNAAYSSVAGLLTNNLQNTIVFVPAALAISGEFVIPSGIQYIGERAFENCSNITTLIIPNYVKEIGDRAFNRCTGIKTVTIEGGRKQNDLVIGSYAFASCTKLASVTIGGSADGTTLDGGTITIGDHAFVPASRLDAKLTSFTIGDGANITKIGDSAFAGQELLSTLSFGTAAIGEIGDYAFEGCSNISSVIIPATTTEIGAHAFDGCTGITSVTIAEGSTALSFGEYAFTGCVRITTVNLPASVSNFDGAVFSGCNALREIVVDPDNTALKSIDGVLYDYDLTTLKFYPIGLVREKEGVITADDLPDSLTTIDKAVFSGNTALTSIVIEAGITEIGDEAFANCSNLTKITFVNSEAEDATLKIGQSAFYKCPFTEIEVPAYTTYISSYAFYGTKFASFAMPAKLTGIGAFAFSSNTKLSSVTIPENVSSIADGAFAGCTALKTLNIEGGETPLSIGTEGHTTATSGAFYNTRLSAVTLPDRVVSIGSYAFTTNSTSTSTSTNSIRSFTAGSGLKRIGFGAFYCAINLDTVTLNEGLEYIGNYAFSSAGYVSGSTVRGLRNVTIPSTVTYIGTYAFGGYKGTYYNALETITFAHGGENPIVIGNDAFAYSRITNVELPKRALAYKEGVENTLYSTEASNQLVYKTFYKIFNNCAKLENITVEEGSTQFTSIGGILYTLNDAGVATELLYCPRANKGVDGVVTIPNTVIVVENGAFYNTTNIHTVRFEEATAAGAELYLGNYVAAGSTTRLEELGIFAGASNSITRLELPKHLVYVGAYAIALRGTSAAQDVEVVFNMDATIMLSENAIQDLDTEVLALPNVSALLGRDYLSEVTANTITFGAGSTFTSMPSYGIEGCPNLTTFEIPKSVKTMGSYAFYCGHPSCSMGITSIIFAENSALTTIGSGAFSDLTELESITLPANVTEIGTVAFQECTSLKTIVLPAGVTGITSSTFSLGTGIVPAIESVTFAGESVNYKVIDGAIYSKDGERLIYFPGGKEVTEFKVADGVKYIEDGAFQFFRGSEMILPEGLERIGHNAFAYSDITEIALPKTILNIGTNAFRECRSLVTFYMDPNSAITALAVEPPSGYVLNGVFENCVSLKNVTLSDNIETLGAHAFQGCTSLETVILPAALKIIDSHIFSGCTSLSAISIPAGVTSIGNQSFTKCEALVNVTIPAAVTSIDSYAFQNDKNLTTVTFENGSMLESIGGSNGKVFGNCPKLTVIDLSVAADLTTLGTSLFEGCTSLETVKLEGTSITALPNNIFANLTALKTVTLPVTLETIGNNAYAGCTAIESVTIPASVSSIGTSAFEGCTALKTVTFAEGSVLTELGTETTANDNIFKNTTALETVTLPMGLELIGGHVFENSGVQKIYQNNGIDEVSLPTALTTIGEYAFSNCDNLTDVVIFGNTSYIGGYAFNDCDELQNLTLSEGVSFIGSLAFAYCENLKAVALPQSIAKLEGNPFAGCIGLTSFTLHEENTAYRFIDGILYDWTAYTLVFNPVSNMATSLELPDTVYEIADGAFVGSHIQNLVLPGQITIIPDYAFANCEDLVSVKFSNSITSIGNYAFNGCINLNNVIIPKSVNKIGNYAFANCTSLSAFVFEEKDVTDSAYSLGTHLFEGCTALTTAVVPNKLASTYLPSYMFANTGIVNAVIPDNVTNLNSSASEGVFANNTKLESVTFLGVNLTAYKPIGTKYFYNCTALTTIIDSASHVNVLNEVGNYSFAGCTALETIYIGGAINIGKYAFDGCTGLKNIYFYLGESQDGVCAFVEIGDYAFKDCTGIEKLYVPTGPTDGQCMIYGKNVFDGWTANQTLIFLNEFGEKDKDGNYTGKIDSSGWWAMIDSAYMDGCNAKRIFREQLFSTETVTIDYVLAYGDGVYFGRGDDSGFRNLAQYTNVKTLNLGSIAPNYNSWAPTVLYTNAFNGFTAEQTINFTAYTYEEIFDLIENSTINAAAFKGCAAKVCDKDGNVLVIDVNTGAITAVTNADGSTTLWTPEA